MSGHDIGPWSYGYGFEACNPEDQESQRILHPDWREIYGPWTEDYKRMYLSGHIGDANARLIAAAPELLEALELIVSDYEWNKANAQSDRSSDYAETARAAIAKATGESA